MAYALGQKDKTSSIETGKYADLIELYSNIFEVPENRICEAVILRTLLEGDETFRSADW